MQGNYRVLLADDHMGVRRAIRQMLQRTGDIEVVGEASNGLEVLQQVEELHPDMTVLDIEMPEMSGLEAARRLRAEHIPIVILILSAYSNPDFIQVALDLEIDGYLVKDDAPSCLVEAIHRIAAGEKGVFSRGLSINPENGAQNISHLCSDEGEPSM